MSTKLFYRTWQANIKIYTEELKDKNYHEKKKKDQKGKYVLTYVKTDSKTTANKCNSSI